MQRLGFSYGVLDFACLPLDLHIENRSRALGVWVCGVYGCSVGPLPEERADGNSTHSWAVLPPSRLALGGNRTCLINWGCFSSR